MPVFLALAACAFASGFALRLIDPLVLPLAQFFAVAPTVAATLATAYALPYALAQPLLGPLGDRFGKARCMQVCVAGFSAALLAGSLAPGFGWLLASRVAAGVFAGGLVPLVLATLGDRYALADRQVMLGRMLFAILGGQTAGSAVSGLVNQAAGWRASLGTAAAIAALATVVAWRGLSAVPATTAGSAAGAAPGLRTLYARVFANPLAPWVYGAVVLEGLIFFGPFPFVGGLIAETGGAGATEAARQAGFAIGTFGIGGLVYAIGVRWLIVRLGVRRMCAVGAAAAALAYALLPLAGVWWLHAAALGVAGFAFSMIHGSLQTQATELAPTARGSAVALFAAGLFTGQGAGPLVFGAAARAVGSRATLWLCAAAMVVLGAVVTRRVLR